MRGITLAITSFWVPLARETSSRKSWPGISWQGQMWLSRSIRVSRSPPASRDFCVKPTAWRPWITLISYLKWMTLRKHYSSLWSTTTGDMFVYSQDHSHMTKNEAQGKFWELVSAIRERHHSEGPEARPCAFGCWDEQKNCRLWSWQWVYWP